jgi:hypothetical protein
VTTSLDADIIPAAFDLIQDLGKAVTYRIPDLTPAATTSEVTVGTPTDYSVRITPPQEKIRPSWKEGDPPESRDMWRALLPTGEGTSDAIAFTPLEDQGHEVIWGGVSYKVISVREEWSGDDRYGFTLDFAR